MTPPATPLEPIADALEDLTEMEYPDLKNGMSYSPAEMLERGQAEVFSIDVFDHTFTILAMASPNHYSGIRVTTVLYEGDTDLEALDEDVRDTEYLDTKHTRPGELVDDDVREDVQHLLATNIGYHVRWVLDGRDYRFRTSDHDEPLVESLTA